jgi:hypothetical protein
VLPITIGRYRGINTWDDNQQGQQEPNMSRYGILVGYPLTPGLAPYHLIELLQKDREMGGGGRDGEGERDERGREDAGGDEGGMEKGRGRERREKRQIGCRKEGEGKGEWEK